MGLRISIPLSRLEEGHEKRSGDGVTSIRSQMDQTCSSQMVV